MSWWWILCKTSLPQAIGSICLGSHPPDPQKLGTNIAKRHLPSSPLRPGVGTCPVCLHVWSPIPNSAFPSSQAQASKQGTVCITVNRLIPEPGSSDLFPCQEEVEWSERITSSKWCVESFRLNCIGILLPPDTWKLRSHCLTAVLFLFLSCHLIYPQKVTAVFINNEVKCKENSSRILRGSRVFSIWWAYGWSPSLSLLPLPQTFVWWWHKIRTLSLEM